MKNVTVYINSSTQDSYTKFGVEFAETSLTALMTPSPLKEYITNKSAMKHGKEVVPASIGLPKVDEREVQLTFSLEGNSLAQFLTRYKAFCAEMKKGAFDLTVLIQQGSTYLRETYHLKYLSCSQYSEFNGRLGKFVAKFNEPNPEDRTVQHSSDIVI